MRSLLPYKKIVLPTILSLITLVVVQKSFAETRTNVSVKTNAGNNRVIINGKDQSSTYVKKESRTVITINGKEYVNDDTGGTHDIVEETGEGKVEVHVNSDKAKKEIESTITKPPKPTEPDLEDIEDKKEETENLIEKIQEEINDLLKKISSWFD